MPDRLLTAAEAGRELGLTSIGVRYLARRYGLGQQVGSGRTWLFSAADLERLRQRRTTPGPVPREDRENPPETHPQNPLTDAIKLDTIGV